jgi:hypothetical protein
MARDQRQLPACDAEILDHLARAFVAKHLDFAVLDGAELEALASWSTTERNQSPLSESVPSKSKITSRIGAGGAKCAPRQPCPPPLPCIRHSAPSPNSICTVV